MAPGKLVGLGLVITEEQRPQLSGAREFQVTKGDMLHVPARVWHQMLTEPGESITYALINVIE